MMKNKLKEEHRNIEGFPEYEITREGRIWSNKSNKYLSVHDNETYNIVALFDQNGNKKSHCVAKLVIKAYAPEKFKGKEDSFKCKIDYIDGNKYNTHIDNLDWVERDYKDEYYSKLHTSELRSLSDKEKEDIKRLYQEGEKVSELALEYIIHPDAVIFLCRDLRQGRKSKTSYEKLDPYGVFDDDDLDVLDDDDIDLILSNQ